MIWRNGYKDTDYIYIYLLVILSCLFVCLQEEINLIRTKEEL